MMLNYYCYLIFMPLIFISSIIILFTNSWFSQWMIMEINLISFLSILVFEKKKSNIPMNYFLIQSFNSYLFIMLMMNLNFLNLSISSAIIFFTNLCMLTKMGMPPFYLWYMKIMKNLNWMNCFLLMTIQKLIPLIIMNNLINLNYLIMFKFNILNLLYMSLLCSFLGLQNLNLKILMSYSSIIQMTWVILLMYLNEIMFMNYYLIYSFITLLLSMMFNEFNLMYVKDLFYLKFKFNWMYILYMNMLFSMASLPPFFGFLMKWISIQLMSMNMPFFLIFILIINSLISLYFYIRLMYICFISSSYSLKLNFLKIKINKFNKNLIILSWLMLILLFFYEIF